MLSPLLFNVYLDDALNSQPILSDAIKNKALKAFADDIATTFTGEIKLKWTIEAFQKLEQTHQIVINVSKSKFICKAKPFKLITAVNGVQKVEEYKYLGMRLTNSKTSIKANAKKQVKKNQSSLCSRIRHQSHLSQKILFSAYLRSLIIYQFTPLFATGIINKGEIDRYEVYLKRKFMHLAYDIKSDVIMNVNDWFRHKLSETVDYLYRKMILKELPEQLRV